jgi:PEP-CTERM motif
MKKFVLAALLCLSPNLLYADSITTSFLQGQCFQKATMPDLTWTSTGPIGAALGFSDATFGCQQTLGNPFALSTVTTGDGTITTVTKASLASYCGGHGQFDGYNADFTAVYYAFVDFGLCAEGVPTTLPGMPPVGTPPGLPPPGVPLIVPPGIPPIVPPGSSGGSSVPEPASLVLVGGGLLALARRRRWS